MSSPPDPEAPAELQGADLLPSTKRDYVASMAHYYRGELSRTIAWRDRLDHTTNWAIAASAGMLSVSLSSPTSHHAVILCCMGIVFLLLLIETRRYRFFHLSRRRIRLLERNYYARLIDPEVSEDGVNWRRRLAADLRSPRFGASFFAAIRNRIRRNYLLIYLILIFSWWLKISTIVLDASEGEAKFVHTVTALTNNARVAYIPGAIVIGGVTVFFFWLLFMTFSRGPEDTDESMVEADV
jgi:uncharacterized membrane protein